MASQGLHVTLLGPVKKSKVPIYLLFQEKEGTLYDAKNSKYVFII